MLTKRYQSKNRTRKSRKAIKKIDTPSSIPLSAGRRELKLGFFKDYLIQLHKEIDIEKQEGTKILHLKIIAAGLILAFGLKEEQYGAPALIFLPFAFLSLDLMQSSRFDYVIHRWRYLAEKVAPLIRELLCDPDLNLFSEEVIARSTKSEYEDLESTVRTLLMIPVVFGSIAAFWLVAGEWGLKDIEAGISTILWGMFLFSLSLLFKGVYIRLYVVIALGLFSILCVLFWRMSFAL